MTAWSRALLDLYRTEQRSLIQTAFLIAGDRESAEDIVQTVVTRLAQGHLDVRDPRPYLYRSVVNEARDVVKSAERRRRMWTWTADEAEVDATGPSSEALDLWTALGQLSVKHRTAVVLRYFGGWNDAEIAEVFDVRQATVRSWVHRGIKHLRESLEEAR